MKFLNKDHIISGEEYFRQKRFCPYDSDNYAVSTFISQWTSIRYLVGSIWKNKHLFELDIKDEHYVQNPSLLQTYEFIMFDSQSEKLETEIFTDNEIKYINKRMYLCFRDWNDWPEFFFKNASQAEIDYIVNTPANLCPDCNKGTVIEKLGKYGKFVGCTNYPKCHYIENKLLDSYSKYIFRFNELTLLKERFKKYLNNN